MTTTMTTKRALSALLAAGLGLSASACQTSGPRGEREEASGPKEPPPPITRDMPLPKALEAGIEHGGDTLADVKRLVKRRQEGPKASPMLEQAIRDGLTRYEHHQLINAVHLYMTTPGPMSPELFTEMVRANRPLANQLGWQLAATKASPAVAQAVEKELTRAIAEDDEEAVLLPQMANAIAANRLRGSYTFARRGLMVKGDEEFAAAMGALDPKQASEDFLQYLSLAPAEELRQLTLSSVNMYTCVAILKHMQKTPPSIANAHIDHLFFYAVSRNTGLAELAQSVLETYVPNHAEYLAQALARHPTWVQIAYLENARRRMSPRLGILLGELKKATAEQDVAQEIDEIKF